MGGLATLMLFAPAALFWSLDLGVENSGTGVLSALAFFASISGFVAGAVHIHVARRTLRHEPVGDSAFMYLYAHHVCVAGVIAFAGALSPVAGSTVPVGIGLSVGLCSIVVAMDTVVPHAHRREERA